MRVPTTTATGPVVAARTSCIRGLKTRPRSHKSWTRCRGLVTYNTDGTLHEQDTHNGSSTNSVSYGYDTAGLLTSRTDGAGTTSYTYDPLHRVATSTTPATATQTGGIVTSFTYDGDGNLATTTQPGVSSDNVTTSYGYYANHLPQTISYSDGTTPNVAYTYDADGHRLTMTDGTGETDYTSNLAGWVTTVTDGAHNAVDYGYDLTGDPTSITYPNGQSVARGYDAADRLISVTDWNSHTTGFGYNPDGALTAITYPNGVTETTTVDPADTPTEISDTASSSTLADYTYGHSTAHRTTSVTTAGTNPGPNETYGFNGFGQLDSYTSDVGTSGSYSHDNAGQVTGTPDIASLSYDAAGELTGLSDGTTLSYDGRGERTTTTPTTGTTVNYSYDQAGRLTNYTRGTTTASYTYNGDGLRATVTNGTTSNDTWDTATSSDPLLLTDHTTNYIYGPNDQPIEQTNTSGTSVTYLLHDQASSTRLLTDPTGNVTGTYAYDPYGKTISHTGTATSSLEYGGQYLDDTTGLYYLRARYYDPTTAQFLTRDPLEDETGAPYSYAGDDPLDFGDPTGLDYGWNPIDDVKQAGSDLGSAADAVGDAIGDGFVWADQHLNPMYYAVEGYAKEIDAYESGCGYWDSVKYGAIGTGEAAAATALWYTPLKGTKWLPKNNLLRVGPASTGGPFRVSFGAQQKYWQQMPRWRQLLQPFHVHMERAKGGITWNPTGQSTRLWGTWK